MNKKELIDEIEKIADDGTKNGIWKMNPLGGYKGYKYRKKDGLELLRDNLMRQMIVSSVRSKIRLVERNEI